jgi:HSP20 family protein
MTTLQQLSAGLGRAWDAISEGWHQLSRRATHALTRFHPRPRSGELETAEDQVVRNASRWGLLPAEVVEGADEVVVKLEAPGLEPDDFEIEVTDSVLVVRGEKHAQREERQGNYHLMERAYGYFERAIPLPVAVEEAGSKATYRNGVLQVSLPKHAQARRRRIEVK